MREGRPVQRVTSICLSFYRRLPINAKLPLPYAVHFTDLPVPKDIVVTTPEEIARRGDVVGTVLRPALREGKVLYERS